MKLIGNKKLLEYILVPLVLVGTYPLISEINAHSKEFFSQNYTKWITLWSIFYLKTNDYVYSSIVSLIIMITLPSIFFGKITYANEKTKEGDY